MDLNNILHFLRNLKEAPPSNSSIKKIQAQITNWSHSPLSENDGELLVKCVLKYIDCIINIASNKTLKDQIKMCKKSFNIIKEIVSGNVQNIFMKLATKRVFDIIIEVDVQSCYIKKELLKTFIKCIENSDKVLRKKVVQDLPDIYLFKLMDTVSTYGDYDFQLHLIETVFRMYGKSIITAKLKDLIPESQELSESLAEITGDTFDEDVRKFLNLLNSKSGKVFSVICQSVYLGNLRCEKPMDGIDGLWVDFNLSEKAISWYCNKSSFENKDTESDNSLPEGDDRIWNLVTLFTSDVESVQIHTRPIKSEEVLIYFKLKDACISSCDENQMIVGAADNLKFVVSHNSNKTNTLLSKVLPSLFSAKFCQGSVKVSSSKKVYKPLNVKVSKNSKSELSKSKSDASSIVAYMDPITGKFSKSDINSSSRDETSFKKTISVSSASTKCEVISIPDSSTASTVQSLKLVPLQIQNNNKRHQDTEKSQYETAQTHRDSQIDKPAISKSLAPAAEKGKKCSVPINSRRQKIKSEKENINYELAEGCRSQRNKISRNIPPKLIKISSPTPKPALHKTFDEDLRSVEEDMNYIQILSGRCSGSNVRYSQLSRSSAMTTSTPRKLSDNHFEVKTNINETKKNDSNEKPQSSSIDNFETAKDCSQSETNCVGYSQDLSEDFDSLKVNIFKDKGTVENSKDVQITRKRKIQNTSEYFQERNSAAKAISKDKKEKGKNKIGVAASKTEDIVIVISEDYITPSQDLFVISDEETFHKNQKVFHEENKENVGSGEVVEESVTATKISKSVQVVRKTDKSHRIEPATEVVSELPEPVKDQETSSDEALMKVTSSQKDILESPEVSETHYKVTHSMVDSEEYIEHSESDTDCNQESSDKIKISKSIFIRHIKTESKKAKVTKKTKCKGASTDQIMDINNEDKDLVTSSGDKKENVESISSASDQVLIVSRKINDEIICEKQSKKSSEHTDDGLEIVETNNNVSKPPTEKDEENNVVTTTDSSVPIRDVGQKSEKVQNKLCEQPQILENMDEILVDSNVRNLPSPEIDYQNAANISFAPPSGIERVNDGGNSQIDDTEKILEMSKSKLTTSKLDCLKKGVQKGRRKRRIICESDESDKENFEVTHISQKKTIPVAKILPQLYVKLSKIDEPQITREVSPVVKPLIEENSSDLQEAALNNINECASTEKQTNLDAALEEIIDEQSVMLREPLKEITTENVKTVEDKVVEEITFASGSFLKAPQEQITREQNTQLHHPKKVTDQEEELGSEGEELSGHQNNVMEGVEEEEHNIFDDIRKTAGQNANVTRIEQEENGIASIEVNEEKEVEEENGELVLHKSYYDQTLSTTLGTKRRRKLYNPKDLSYWQDTIVENSMELIDEPPIIEKVINKSATNKSVKKTRKLNKVNEKPNRKSAEKTRKPSKKKPEFNQIKKIKVVNPNFILTVPDDREKQRYGHLRPVFHNMLESFRQEVGRSFSDILKENIPKEELSKKVKKKNVRRYTKRTMKYKVMDRTVRAGNDTVSTSSGKSLKLRKRHKSSNDTPYNSPVKTNEKTPVNDNNNRPKRINIISDIQIRPKRVLLESDNEVLRKKGKYNENKNLATFSQETVKLHNYIEQVTPREEVFNGIAPLDSRLPIISENITNEEINSWIDTGSPHYNKYSEVRSVLKHAYPMFNSLLSSSTVGQERQDILNICSILKNYV